MLKASVIFSTYNSPSWLEKVLIGFLAQDEQFFEIIVADDGSTADTLAVIERIRSETAITIKHVWQPDEGFQKCRILNKAIAASAAEYLIFTDGDCIPRQDFVATHLFFSELGYFLSGGYFKLPMETSEAIKADDITSQRSFNLTWLRSHDLPIGTKDFKLIIPARLARIFNRLSPAKPTWNGHNASCFKKDAIAVNGFNEDMQYGGEDCEFGDRLGHYGLQCKIIRYSAVCIHLDHTRGYATPEVRAKNSQIREQTKNLRTIQTLHGLNQYI